MSWRKLSVQLSVLSLLATTSGVATTRAMSAATRVIGALEAVDQNGIVSGWALDVETPGGSIQVHVYLDGPAGVGMFVAAAAANVPRGESSPYGFRVSVPSQYWDGRPHRVYVYGISSSGVPSDHALLSGSPQTFMSNSTIVRLDNGVLRVGIETRCGGTLVELSMRGQNLVNNADCTGRQIQAALYDGNSTYDACSGCEGIWGWDPVQGGDIHNSGSPVLAQRVTADSIYIATRPNEWYPDNKGGGPGRPVASDVVIEQTVSFVPNYLHALRLHYRISHLGSDTHASAVQEFPAVWVNRGFDNFVTYSGPHPWTGDAVSVARLNGTTHPAPQRRVSERWAALVNDQSLGLMVFVPQQYPYALGFQFDGAAGEFGFGANYFRPHIPFAFGPGSVLEADVYLIVGDYRQARADLRALHTAGAAWPDILPPFGTLDLPVANQTANGVIPVAGWMLDNVDVAQIDVLVDGTAVGAATYGVSRPDVSTVYPQAPERVGFAYALDTSRLGQGSHRLSVRARDRAGNIAILPDVPIVVP
jgi:hypothetical protein